MRLNSKPILLIPLLFLLLVSYSSPVVATTSPALEYLMSRGDTATYKYSRHYDSIDHDYDGDPETYTTSRLNDSGDMVIFTIHAETIVVVEILNVTKDTILVSETWDASTVMVSDWSERLTRTIDNESYWIEWAVDNSEIAPDVVYSYSVNGEFLIQNISLSYGPSVDTEFYEVRNWKTGWIETYHFRGFNHTSREVLIEEEFSMISFVEGTYVEESSSSNTELDTSTTSAISSSWDLLSIFTGVLCIGVITHFYRNKYN